MNICKKNMLRKLQLILLSVITIGIYAGTVTACDAKESISISADCELPAEYTGSQTQATTTAATTSVTTTAEEKTEEKRMLTLDDVKALAKKGDELVFKDFSNFIGEDIGSGLYLMRYTIDDDFYVTFSWIGDLDEKLKSVMLVRTIDGEVYDEIEIRSENLDDFISEEIVITTTTTTITTIVTTTTTTTTTTAVATTTAAPTTTVATTTTTVAATTPAATTKATTTAAPVVTTTPAPTTKATTTAPTDNNAAYASEIIRLVNAERVNNGLAPLAESATLNTLASVRANELITLFSHTRPNGGNLSSIFAEYSVGWWAIGENIAMGQTTPQVVMTDWMNSQGHRENILSSDFTSIGVGVVKHNGTYYWVQIFANLA